MKIGGIKIERGRILNLAMDAVASSPSFDPDKMGEFTFSLDDRVLRFNDGKRLIALNTTVSEDPNLISSLGSNWLNEDLSFNPVPFNALSGLSGLDSNSSLFDVIEQLSDLIKNVSTVTIDEIDVSNVVAPDMSVLAYLAGDLILLEIEQIIDGSTISLNFDNLSGFNIKSTTHGNMLIFDDNKELVSRKVNYTYSMHSSSVDHRIDHNLGAKYCSVFCIDPVTSRMVIPTSIDFVSTSHLVVHLPSKTGLIAFVRNFDAPL